MPTELREAKVIVKIETRAAEQAAEGLEKKVKRTRREQEENERKDERRRRIDGRSTGGRGGVGPAGAVAAARAARSKVLGTVAKGVGIAALADFLEPIVRGIMRGAGLDPDSAAFKVLQGLLVNPAAVQLFRDILDNAIAAKQAQDFAVGIQEAAALTGGDVSGRALLEDFVDFQRIRAEVLGGERGLRNLKKELIAKDVTENVWEEIDKHILNGSVGK